MLRKAYHPTLLFPPPNALFFCFELSLYVGIAASRIQIHILDIFFHDLAGIVESIVHLEVGHKMEVVILQVNVVFCTTLLFHRYAWNGM